MARSWETIEIGVFGFGVVAYAAAFALVSMPPAPAPGADDLRILCVLMVLGSAGAVLVKERRSFLVLHGVKTLLVGMTAATLGARDATVELLAVLPWVAETSLYLPLTVAVATGTAGLLSLAALDLGAQPAQGAAVEHLAAVLLPAGAAVAAGTLITGYRDRAIRESVTVARLHQDVDNLIRANQAFQDHADTIESVTEETERNRITRELHDVIGYSLTNVIMMMNAGKVLSRDNPAQLEQLFLQARAHADEALQESRKILYALRAIQPASRKGLNAIHHLAQSFQNATNIRVEVAWGNLPQSLGPDVDGAMFRLVQEGMTNALRHGHARNVRITFWRFSDRVQVQVWDNGLGVEAVTEGIGLTGMRERFALLGGTVAAAPVADGFLVAAIPLAPEWAP